MPRHRLGVVLLVPPPAAVEIDGLRRACGDPAVDRVPPHVTLVPPVNVAAGALDQAVAIVRVAAAASRPLALSLGPVATFLPVTPVLYLAVDGDLPGLLQLYGQVSTGPLGRPPVWPFVPHVTLADGAEPDRIAAAVVALGDYHAEIAVPRVHVMREDPDRVWRPVADAPLAAAVVIGRGGLPVELVLSEALDPEGERFFAWAWPEHETASYGTDLPRAQPFAVTARREGTVVGVALGVTDDELVLDRLVVAPTARRQGVGSHLLAEVERVAVARGCARMVLIAPRRSLAEALGRERGWVDEQVLPRFRHGRDFVRMVRRLG